MNDYEIERLTGSDAYDVVEPLVTEYLEYIADRFTGDLGVRIGDRPAFVAGRHEAIRLELPNLITGRAVAAVPSPRTEVTAARSLPGLPPR